MPEPLDATVIICTRNRSQLFAEACRSLLTIDTSGLEWELLIVDNASTDDTAEVARSFQSEFPFPVSLVREDTLGLSSARNAGIRHARGRVLAFLDDDAFPDSQWLKALAEDLSQDGAYAAGGPVEPQFRSQLPAWFSDRFLPYLTVWDLGPESLNLTYNEYPRGANMAFRREAFERFGLFSTHLGRKARSLLSCEEIEICLRIERGGGRVLYSPGARVRHVVEGDRITHSWLIQRFRAQGTSEAIVEWQHAGMPGLVVGARRSLQRALHSRRSTDSETAIVRKCELASVRGYFVGILRAPLTVPRYRASTAAGPAKRWRPFA